LQGDDDLAFDLFVLGRKGSVGALIMELESWEFTRARAADIARRIRIFDAELVEIEEKERKKK
jgi:hypothetical protein